MTDAARRAERVRSELAFDNQPGEIGDYDPFTGDRALEDAVCVFGANWARARIGKVARQCGAAATRALAADANRFPPELVSHDRFGRRIDEIAFHPAWHRLMEMALASGTHAIAWTEDRPGAHVARAAMSYLWNQAENGICCPLAMAFAAPAALRHAPALAGEWEPRLFRTAHDPRPVPAEDKAGILVGMAMTERQGGSDLRQTRTEARPMGAARGPGAPYRLDGHKWFFSVPHCDIFLTLARTEAGVGCFLARGWLPDGRRNGLRIDRLKDKCGNRANASAEVTFEGLEAVMLGAEGRGIATLIEMAHLTRLDIAVASAGLMRQALSQAIHHARWRRAFQRRLADQPLMGAVLADLAAEAEAMLWLAFRVAATPETGRRDPAEALFGRIAVPAAKYWACRRAPGFVAEALECHGGNGYVETHLMARLYREAPLNGIWEGAGNVICLDVARAVARAPETVDAFLAEIRQAAGEPALDTAAAALEPALRGLPANEAAARHVVERMAQLLQASLLLRPAPAEVAGHFVDTRLGGAGGGHYGAFDRRSDCAAIIERATVA